MGIECECSWQLVELEAFAWPTRNANKPFRGRDFRHEPLDLCPPMGSVSPLCFGTLTRLVGPLDLSERSVGRQLGGRAP